MTRAEWNRFCSWLVKRGSVQARVYWTYLWALIISSIAFLGTSWEPDNGRYADHWDSRWEFFLAPLGFVTAVLLLFGGLNSGILRLRCVHKDWKQRTALKLRESRDRELVLEAENKRLDRVLAEMGVEL